MLLKCTLLLLYVTNSAFGFTHRTRDLTLLDLNRLGNNEQELARPDRIVGGIDVEEGEYAWQVSLQIERIDGTRAHFCGGTLINKEWVLTAAHCLDNNVHFVVAAGIWNVDEPSITYQVLDNYQHENFNRQTMENDIGMIKIDGGKATKFSKAVKGIVNPLPVQDQRDLTKRTCFVTGFGRLHAGGTLPRTLQVAKVELQDDATCRVAFSKTSSLTIFDSNVCAGGKDRDACQGDSGGPLACCVDGKDCRLTGITSWGLGCATYGYAGVYTETAYFFDWVAQKIAMDKKKSEAE